MSLPGAQAGENILSVETKRLFDSTPAYVSVGPADVATVWKKPGMDEYFSPGIYVGLVEEAGVVKGLKYTKLSEQQKEAVVQGIRVRDKKAVVRFELE